MLIIRSLAFSLLLYTAPIGRVRARLESRDKPAIRRPERRLVRKKRRRVSRAPERLIGLDRCVVAMRPSESRQGTMRERIKEGQYKTKSKRELN